MSWVQDVTIAATSGDITEALIKAISSTSGAGPTGKHGARIILAGPGPYLLTKAISVLADQAVSLETRSPFAEIGSGEGITAAVSLNLSSGCRVFFKGLAFTGGGVEVDGVVDSGRLTFSECAFGGLVGIKTGNGPIVGGLIEDCWFVDCEVGLWLSKCRGWDVARCRFSHNTYDAVLVNSVGVRLVECDFLHQEDAGRRPNVLVSGGRHIRLRECCFRHPGTVPSDAAIAIRLALPGATTTDDVQVVNCTFEPGFKSVVCLEKPVKGMRLRGCTVNGAVESIVDETYEATSGSSHGAHQNAISGGFYMGSVGNVFSRGGRGFEVFDEVLRRARSRGAGDATVTSGNLLQSSEDLSVAPWTGGGVTVGVPVTQTDDLSPAARQAVCTVSGLGTLVQVVTTKAQERLVPSGAAVFSVWVRSASTEESPECALYVLKGDIAVGGSRETRFPLTGYWYRYSAVVERVPDPSDQGDLKVVFESFGPGSMDVWHPQLESGDTPTAYIANGLAPTVGETVGDSVFHGPRQPQSLVVGTRVVGYTSGTPTQESALSHSKGDILLNVAPDEAKVGSQTDPQYDGWVRGTYGGKPAWLPFGRIVK